MIIVTRTRKFFSNIKELTDLKERVIKLEEKERKLEKLAATFTIKDDNFEKNIKEIKTDVRLLVETLIKKGGR